MIIGFWDYFPKPDYQDNQIFKRRRTFLLTETMVFQIIVLIKEQMRIIGIKLKMV
jgi:hypothetical protein